MFRILMIILVLIILATIVVGEDLAIPPPATMPEIIVPTEETAEMPDNFLPAEFIEEVTAESPLPASPAQNASKSPMTFNVNDLPRTSGMPQNSGINARDTLLESTPVLPTRNETEAGKVETTALPEATAPAFMPNNAIAQETLTFADMTPSDYGLLDSTNGGFSKDIWQGISAGRAQNLILPFLENSENPTYLDAWIQQKLGTLMLTRAAAPDGATKTDWLAFRAQSLLDMGQSAAAFNLLSNVTAEQRSADAALTKAWATAQLMAGQSAAVCPSVANQVRNNSTPFWRKNLLLCQFMQGETQKLALSLNVTTQTEKLADKGFFDALTAAHSGQEVVLGAASDTMALDDVHISTLLAGALNVVPSREKLSTPYTSTLQKWRDDVRASMASRLHAAEQLALRAPNAPNVATLKSLYLSVQFSAQDVTAPIEAAKQQATSSLGRALLFQATQNAPLPALKAATQAALFDAFSANHLMALNRHFVLPQSTLTAMPELAWLAPKMIKYALLNNQVDIARPWLVAMQQNDNLSAELTEQRHTLALAVDVFQRGNVAQPITAWLNNTSSGNVQSILAALDALGLSIPAEVWHQAAADDVAQSHFTAEAVGPLWLRMVADGLQNKRTGEVLLLLMQPLQGKDVTEIAPLTLANIITGLGYLEQDSVAMDLVMQLLLTNVAMPTTEKTPDISGI